jgi:hypothetical protein
LLDDVEAVFRGLTEKTVEECSREYFSDSTVKKDTSPREKRGFSAKPFLIAAGCLVAMVAGAFLFIPKKNLDVKGSSVFPVEESQPAETKKPGIDSMTQYVPLSGIEGKSDLKIGKAGPAPQPPAAAPGITSKTIEPKKNEMEKRENPEKIASLAPQKEKPPIHEPVKGLPPVSVPQAVDTAVLLQQRYGVNDPIQIADIAITKKEFADAMRALSMAPQDHPKAAYKQVLLLDIYRNTGKFEEAKGLIDHTDIGAAEWDLAIGKFYADKGMYQKAIQYFNQTQEKKCLLPDRRSRILADALYWCARSSQKLYDEDRSQQNLEAARDAWNNLKKNLSSRTEDPRFKEAIEVLSKL